MLLGHGSGGRLSAELIGDVLVPALGEAALPGPLEDAATFAVGGAELAVSTDAYVISPFSFAGGDIGSLAVHGTVNDPAMRAAMPVALTIAYVIEEGFPLAEIHRIAASVGAAARDAGVPVLTGDTKVVGRGAADGILDVCGPRRCRCPDRHRRRSARPTCRRHWRCSGSLACRVVT